VVNLVADWDEQEASRVERIALLQSRECERFRASRTRPQQEAPARLIYAARASAASAAASSAWYELRTSGPEATASKPIAYASRSSAWNSSGCQ
jgi:hypothetical protein